MHISTSTCLCSRYYTPNGQSFDLERAIILLSEAGFRYLDIDFTHIDRYHPLSSDNWEAWGDKLVEITAEKGVTVEQAHAHWYRLYQMQSKNEEWNIELLRRSLNVIGKFGKGLSIVAHTHSVYDENGYNYKKSFQKNLEFFSEIGETAAKQGNRIAIEILFPEPGVMFGCCPEELIQLRDTLNDSLFGICWDFGHAALAGVDQIYGLKAVGSRLIATHCHDNFGVKPDIHLMPFMGNIDWPVLMKTLKEINYKGNLNLEVHMLTKKLPADMQLEGCCFALHTVEHLKEMYDRA